ncbi:hypothetical protein [Pyrobaculum ferrireducens]|uniref:hypothetical protein n=1 Tax=Pyrobaculum ferrireducens TaxID=1104324 RepID=UPI0011E585DC|nr:hypothetical protein [Pyrobaculum ferrireducens]
MLRKVDGRGRIVIGREYAGRRLYVVKVGGGFFITPDRELAERVRSEGIRAVLDAYYKLLDVVGEPAPEEVERLVEEELWRGVSSTRRS